MPIQAVLLIFGGLQPEWAQMGAAPTNTLYVSYAMEYCLIDQTSCIVHM